MPSIAIFKHDPECSSECIDGMIWALTPRFKVKTFDETEFNSKTLDKIDIVAFPGGIGDALRYYAFFKRKAGNAIADFVEQGGAYLGICMGAYWAGENYFDLLNNLEPVQYIKRPNADIRRSYATVAKIQWNEQPESMFFYDGCTFVGDGKADVIARYANGDPMAIIQDRVGLIGCHPESMEDWYSGYNYFRNKWHHGSHHKLLLDFTEKLIGKQHGRHHKEDGAN